MGLTWTESLNTGIPEIDQQHKQLIDQMNLLYNAIQNNKGSEEIQNIMTFLSSYVYQHFGYEENCMHRYKCPIATTNKSAHTQFINSLNEINEELNTKGASISLAIKVNQNLLEWFGNHIRKIDTQLKACMP
jgi:hemerythrin